MIWHSGRSVSPLDWLVLARLLCAMINKSPLEDQYDANYQDRIRRKVNVSESYFEVEGRMVRALQEVDA